MASFQTLTSFLSIPLADYILSLLLIAMKTASKSTVNPNIKNENNTNIPRRVAFKLFIKALFFSAILLVIIPKGEYKNSLFYLFIRLQENILFWLNPPDIQAAYLFTPTIILSSIISLIMWLSPRPKAWSRVFLVSILIGLTVRYIAWRATSTLYLNGAINSWFSLSIFLIESLLIFGALVQLYLAIKVKFRNRQADLLQINVLSGQYQPAVDIFVPTYNEPLDVLRRTIVGCQAIDYARKTIYLLDDKRRPSVASLAVELGCQYIARDNNRHAKAGNLNNALGKTDGELVVVFDADFVPSVNFLSRTIGFFQDPHNALLQTHQSFFNPDPVARNLGLENELTHEVEVFSRHYQVIRDSIDTALCYGSSFVVRRSALEVVGGFVTGGLSEDYYTGVVLSANGYRVIYLNESLSAGLSAGTMADHIAQRLRWTRGTLQSLYLEANPLTIPGLTWSQRVAHFEGILQWFSSVFRIFFLLLPGAIVFWNLIPMRLSWQGIVYFILPFYAANILSYGWLNFRSRSVFVSDIYAVAQCFPIALTVIQTLIRPFSQGFRVTPKGHVSSQFIFHWKLALPLLGILPLMLLFLG